MNQNNRTLGQTDRFIPGFEKLLAILNRFQDSLLRNLQVPTNQSNHLISSPANGIRNESMNHNHDRDQIGCDSPQIGFSKPPSSSIMGGLLNDHYLMDQRRMDQNSFRNQPGKKLFHPLPGWGNFINSCLFFGYLAILLTILSMVPLNADNSNQYNRDGDETS